MKKLIATALGVAAFTAAFGQGTASLANNLGGTIYAILTPGGTTAGGAGYSVEVFTFNASSAGGFGTQIGAAVSPAASGRFNLGTVEIPGTTPGGTATLIVRAWDVSTGASYDAATVKGSSSSFVTGILGGDPDGVAGPLLPITPVSMVTGTATGFQSFALTPEPTTIALGALGAAALLIRRRK